MRSDAVIAGSVGGSLGLLVTAALTWMTWAVYRDGEFDAPFLMVVYTLAVFVTAVLQLVGALKSRIGGKPPEARFFLAAAGAAVLAALGGAGFAFIGVGSTGSFLLIFVAFPMVPLLGTAVGGAWFAVRGSA